MSPEQVVILDTDLARIAVLVDLIQTHAIKQGRYLPILNEPSTVVSGLTLNCNALYTPATEARDYELNFTFQPGEGPTWTNQRPSKSAAFTGWQQQPES